MPQQLLTEGGGGVLKDVEQLGQGAVGGNQAQESHGPILVLHRFKAGGGIPSKGHEAGAEGCHTGDVTPLERILEQHLEATLNEARVVLLCGMRHIGENQ